MAVVGGYEAPVSTAHRRPRPTTGEGLAHLGLFIVSSLVMAILTQVFLIGFALVPFALRRTGRRGRDFFACFIPLYGGVLFVETMWRLTASYVYWSPRSDLPSSPMFFYGVGRSEPWIGPKVRRPLAAGDEVKLARRVNVDDGVTLERRYVTTVSDVAEVDGKALALVVSPIDSFHWVPVGDLELVR